VRFDKKTGFYEQKRVKSLLAAFEGFKSCLALWNILQQNLFEEERTFRAPITDKPLFL
jgi:hypothetical protein